VLSKNEKRKSETIIEKRCKERDKSNESERRVITLTHAVKRKKSIETGKNLQRRRAGEERCMIKKREKSRTRSETYENTRAKLLIPLPLEQER